MSTTKKVYLHCGDLLDIRLVPEQFTRDATGYKEQLYPQNVLIRVHGADEVAFADPMVRQASWDGSKAARADEITALRTRLEAVTEERNVQNDLRQIAEDAADELRARLYAVEKELAEMTAAKDIHQTKRHEFFERAERAEAALALRNGECEAKKIIIAQLEAALATARRDAIMSAHRVIEKRRLDYQVECGMYDPTTGQTEYPGNGEEWVCDLEDLEDAIRALANEADTSARGMP